MMDREHATVSSDREVAHYINRLHIENDQLYNLAVKAERKLTLFKFLFFLIVLIAGYYTFLYYFPR